MKRALILGLVLSLVGLGPVPLSACALMNSKPAECATPASQSQCDHMDMSGNDAPSLVTAGRSCCQFRAPLPVKQSQRSVLLFVAAPPAPLGLPHLPPAVQQFEASVFALDTSPPSLRSLLCTFLI